MRKNTLFVLIAALVLLSACSSSGATSTLENAASGNTDTSPTEIKVGMFYYASYVPLYLAEAEGYYAEQGLDVKLIQFTNPADALVALIQGDIDVTANTLSAGVFRAIAEGTGVRFVADKGYLNESSCTNTAWLVRNEILESGLLDDVSNIRDLSVSYRKTNSGLDYAMDQLLVSHDLTSDSLDIIHIPIPNLLEALNNESIDVVSVAEPWLSRIVNGGSAGIWKAWQQYMPGDQLATIWYGPSLTEEKEWVPPYLPCG